MNAQTPNKNLLNLFPSLSLSLSLCFSPYQCPFLKAPLELHLWKVPPQAAVVLLLIRAAFKWFQNQYQRGCWGSSLMHRNMTSTTSRAACGLLQYNVRRSWILRVIYAPKASFSQNSRTQTRHGGDAYFVSAVL